MNSREETLHTEDSATPASPLAPADVQEPELEGWGLLLKAPIQHTLSCACVGPMPDGKIWCAEDADCTCGYEWRVRLSTYMTMYNAWRKRAEEAETSLIAEHERAERLEREFTALGREGLDVIKHRDKAVATAERRGWIAGRDAAVKECEAQEERWCNSPRGYLNEYEQGRVNSAIDCAAAIRALTPPDAPPPREE